MEYNNKYIYYGDSSPFSPPIAIDLRHSHCSDQVGLRAVQLMECSERGYGLRHMCRTREPD